MVRDNGRNMESTIPVPTREAVDKAKAKVDPKTMLTMIINESEELKRAVVEAGLGEYVQ